MKRIERQNGVWIVDNFLTSEECRQWIIKSENIGYEKAGITRGQKQVINLGVRNNDRIVYDDKDLAKSLYEKSKSILIPETSKAFLIGLNERFRFYRYGYHQEFKPHQDLSYQRNKDVWSEFTFLIYLNEDYEGGNTKFRDCDIEKAEGRLLLFKHDLLHQGSKVLSGIKYVLRTDVMYRRKK